MSLTPEQLRSLSALADTMQALPAEQRQAWLDALDGQHRACVPMLQRLLHTGQGTGLRTDEVGWKALPAQLQALAQQSLAPQRGTAGERIGPYRLLRPLGEGGMGVVWLAERDDGTVRREVALKMPNFGPGQRRWALRFDRERDLLARLVHPHIARLYDAGLDDGGQPYLAMELVSGVPITRFAEDGRLDLPARLALFLQVLAAVQFAHSRLVLHRDLKPSNILVDAQAQVHLLDFGIALPLDADVQGSDAASAPLTEVGQALWTPGYAAPEQIQRGPLSIAVDVWALGVVLYELLTGELPFRPARPGRAAAEEAVLHDEAPRPSRAAQGPQAARWARRLRGDLDNIVLKALRKAPGERYASAEAFALDLQRHLRGEPVSAHPDSLAYRMRKFVVRHRLAMAAGGAVTLALVTGTGVALWQADEARRQSRQAEREARKALAVQDFLVGVFHEADPAHAQGKDQPVREVLARAAQTVTARLADQPQTQAAVAAALVQINLDLGDYAQAQPLAQLRAQTLARLSGSQGPDYAQALLDLARVEAGQLRYGTALERLAQARQALGSGTADALELDIAQLEATSLGMLQRPAEAIVVLERILPRLQRQAGADSWPVLSARSVLSFNLARSGQLPRALALQAEIDPLLDRLGPEHGLERASLRAEAGQVLWRAGELATAATTLQRAIDELDHLQGPRGQVAAALHRDLGLVLLDQGRPAEALVQMHTHADRALALYGEHDRHTAVARQASVMPLLWLGRAPEAAALARDTLAAFVSAGDSDAARQPELRGMQRQAALAQALSGDAGGAVRLLDDVSARELQAKAAPWRRAFTRSTLAGALLAAGQPERAAAVAGEALDLAGQTSVYQARLLAIKAGWTLSLALAAAGHPAEARQAQRTADAAAAGLLPEQHPLRGVAQVVDAALLRAEGQAAAARAQDHAARQALREAWQIELPQPLTGVF